MVINRLGNPVVIADVVLRFAKSRGDFKPPLVVRATDFPHDRRFAVDEVVAYSFKKNKRFVKREFRVISKHILQSVITSPKRRILPDAAIQKIIIVKQFPGLFVGVIFIRNLLVTTQEELPVFLHEVIFERRFIF